MAQHIGYRFDGSYFHLSCMGRVVADILQDEYGVASSAFPMLTTKQNVRLWAKTERKKGGATSSGSLTRTSSPPKSSMRISPACTARSERSALTERRSALTTTVDGVVIRLCFRIDIRDRIGDS